MDQGDVEREILLLEFQEALIAIAEGGLDCQVRFRKSGGTWGEHFLQVLDASRGAVFYNHVTKEFVYVTDLAEIVQFQLNRQHGTIVPFVVYNVSPVKFM
jgi:hypothetical protein